MDEDNPDAATTHNVASARHYQGKNGAAIGSGMNKHSLGERKKKGLWG
jgi:hypothetical protein